MRSFEQIFILGILISSLGVALAQRVRYQKYRYDPWTGRTTSVEEFDEDVRKMTPKQLSKYMNELRKVRKSFEDMRRESEVLERELGFGLGGFPSLMDNSENIIRHALDSVTDQLQRRIGHHVDPKLIEEQEKLDQKLRTADKPTLERNLERLQQTKRELAEAKQRAQALKDELGYDLEDVPGAMKRAEKAIDRGMQAINHRLKNLDHPKQNNFDNTMQKVDNALKTANKEKLSELGNEFKKMQQYMENVTSQLDSFHKDIGFEFDGVFEPLKMAKSILDHGLKSIDNQLSGPGNAPQQQQDQTKGVTPNAADGPSKGFYNSPTTTKKAELPPDSY